jgi:hypothetical protein
LENGFFELVGFCMGQPAKKGAGTHPVSVKNILIQSYTTTWQYIHQESSNAKSCPGGSHSVSDCFAIDYTRVA